jgi:hypothetical protein
MRKHAEYLACSGPARRGQRDHASVGEVRGGTTLLVAAPQRVHVNAPGNPFGADKASSEVLCVSVRIHRRAPARAESARA